MATNYNPQIVTDGLVLYLDAGNRRSYSGTGTTWTDLSQNNNNGTLVNSPTFFTGNLGSLILNGTNQYISTTAIIQAATNSNLQTFSAWLNSSSGSLFGSDASSNGQFHLLIYLSSTNNLNFYESYYGGVSGETIDTVSVVLKSANNVVVVKTAPEKYDVYLNGEKVLNQVTKKASLNSNFNAGRFYATSFFGSNISNYSIYNRALSESEIKQNFNALCGRYGI